MNSPSLWVWQQVEDWRWLHCRLLSEWPHAFGCRQLHPRQPPQLAAHLQLPPQRAAWGQQVHGPDWMWADEAIDALYPLLHQASPEVTGSRPQADAVIARRGSDSAWVCTADCVPILLASREWVAAIHAGWRGTAAKILPNVLQQFLQVGIPASEIRVAMGPAISGAAYQVGAAVAEQVLQTLPPEWDTGTVLLPDPLPGKVRLDLRRVNQAQAQACGILAEHIALSPHCTLSQPQDFFSYRRDGSLRDEQGRYCVQWSGIGLWA
ncbi:MAG: peptidoglycan editing factor PgeF [Thermostichus sp. DG_1_6_bins_120]